MGEISELMMEGLLDSERFCVMWTLNFQRTSHNLFHILLLYEKRLTGPRHFVSLFPSRGDMIRTCDLLVPNHRLTVEITQKTLVLLCGQSP